MKRLLLYISICGLTSCFRPSKISLHQDFEQVAGWYDSSKIKKGSAYSGNYYSVTGPGYEYSQTFNLNFANISDVPVRRIDMGAWVRISDPAAKARLVLSIERGDSTLFWQAIDTENASIKPGEWSRLYFTYDLPAGIKPDDIVKMFLWNVSPGEVDADDFDLHFYLKD